MGNIFTNPAWILDNPEYFMLPNIMGNLARLASPRDLFKLRQGSGYFYYILNPYFLNYANLSLEIRKGQFTSIMALEDIEIKNSCNDELFRFSTNITDPTITPTRCCWTPNVAKKFRELKLFNLWLNNMEHNLASFEPEITLADLISQLCSNIETLELTTIPTTTDFEKPAEKLLQFLTQFSKLKQLIISYRWNRSLGVGPMTLEDLGVIIKSLRILKPKIKISLKTSDSKDCREILINLGNLQDNSETFQIIFQTRNLLQILPLQNVFLPTEIETLNARKFKIHSSTSIFSLRNLRDVVDASRSCLSQIEHLDIFLSLYLHPQPYNPTLEYFNINEETYVRIWLKQLSQLVTKLMLSYKNDLSTGKQMEIFEFVNFWPKLRSLRLQACNQPIEILKNCPNLELLRLDYFNENKCIFHKPDQTHEDALTEYFGSLSKLSHFFFADKYYELILAKPESQATLKNLLPKLQIKIKPCRPIFAILFDVNDNDHEYEIAYSKITKKLFEGLPIFESYFPTFNIMI